MLVILTKNIKNLGKIGDCVKVKPGYARNHLLPKNYAILSTPDNQKVLEQQRATLEKAAAASLAEAKTKAEAIEQLDAICIKARVAHEDKLYGSVGIPDIIQAAEEAGCSIAPSEVCMPSGTIRTLGDYAVKIQLESDIVATLHIKVVPQED